MFNHTRNPYVPERMLYAVVTVLDYEGDVIEYFSNPESAAEVLDRVGGRTVVVPIYVERGLEYALNTLGETARELLAEQEGE